uniref:Uncharacterized protein n=1 Tax=Oryza meridionalis TaxID=40149 RepID=A0A0E0F120_9ORYZ
MKDNFIRRGWKEKFERWPWLLTSASAAAAGRRLGEEEDAQRGGAVGRRLGEEEDAQRGGAAGRQGGEEERRRLFGKEKDARRGGAAVAGRQLGEEERWRRLGEEEDAQRGGAAGRQLGEEERRRLFGEEKDARRGGAAVARRSGGGGSARRSAIVGHLTSFVSRLHGRRAKGQWRWEEEAAMTLPPSCRTTRAARARSHRRAKEGHGGQGCLVETHHEVVGAHEAEGGDRVAADMGEEGDRVEEVVDEVLWQRRWRIGGGNAAVAAGRRDPLPMGGGGGGGARCLAESPGMDQQGGVGRGRRRTGRRRGGVGRRSTPTVAC